MPHANELTGTPDLALERGAERVALGLIPVLLALEALVARHDRFVIGWLAVAVGAAIAIIAARARGWNLERSRLIAFWAGFFVLVDSIATSSTIGTVGMVAIAIPALIPLAWSVLRFRRSR